MNPLRSVAAVLGGVVLLGLLDRLLVATLVSAFAEMPPADDAAYLAARNQPVVLATTLAAHALASVLVGYVIAKIAGVQEIRHAVAAAAVLSASYVAAIVSDNPALPPMWTRVGLLVVTSPALAGGAWIRGQARSIQAEEQA